MNNYIPEKTLPIAIKQPTTVINSNELSLNQSFNDPSKMSPPDNFMEKLMKRMDVYYSPKNIQTKQKFTF
jgi:hypothetical protein